MLLLGCGQGAPQQSGQISQTSGHILSWLMPTTYADGSAASNSDIMGSNIYYGTSPDNMQFAAFVPSPATDLDVVELKLEAGSYYFAVTAVDLTGAESDLSNTVTVRI